MEWRRFSTFNKWQNPNMNWSCRLNEAYLKRYGSNVVERESAEDMTKPASVEVHESGVVQVVEERDLGELNIYVKGVMGELHDINMQVGRRVGSVDVVRESAKPISKKASEVTRESNMVECEEANGVEQILNMQQVANPNMNWSYRVNEADLRRYRSNVVERESAEAMTKPTCEDVHESGAMQEVEERESGELNGYVKGAMEEFHDINM